MHRERIEQAMSMEDHIAGKHPVLEALRSGRTVNKIWIAESMGKNLIQPILAEARNAGVPVQKVDKRKLDQMAGDVAHQGVIAQVAPYGYVEIEELLSRAAELKQAPLLLILDEIEDPHNLGSILRTADCAGVHGIIVPKRRSAGITATVSKISAGAVEYVPVARVTNLSQTIEILKQSGIWIVGADVHTERTLYDVDFTLPVAIVVGNEGKGIGRLVKESCDFHAKLPMHGRINSLNASVAAALFMYEAVRQRLSGG